jgi:hypothetical protein
MPRSAGVYALPLPPFVAGARILSNDVNTDLADIATALTGSVARDGTAGMLAALPMGANKITGLAAASAAGDAVRYEQVGETVLARTVISGTPTAVDFALPNGFTSFRLVGTTIFSASGSFNLRLRISTNGGASYDAGGTDYASAYSFQSSTLDAGSTGNSGIVMTPSSPASNPHNFTAFIVPGDGAFGLRAWGNSTGTEAAGVNVYTGTFAGARGATGRATNVRVFASAAMANTGVITLFGVL